MSNAARILHALDERLGHRCRLVLYGRAALQLGFSDAPRETAFSKDVDAIVPVADLDRLRADEGFWNALEATNEHLRSTHLFGADQVLLRSDWEKHLIPLPKPELKWLHLFRPATLDLILTKMMRGADAEDMSDARFLIERDGITQPLLEQAIAEVQGPDIPEIWEAFEQAVPIVLAHARTFSATSPQTNT